MPPYTALCVFPLYPTSKMNRNYFPYIDIYGAGHMKTDVNAYILSACMDACMDALMSACTH